MIEGISICLRNYEPSDYIMIHILLVQPLKKSLYIWWLQLKVGSWFIICEKSLLYYSISIFSPPKSSCSLKSLFDHGHTVHSGEGNCFKFNHSTQDANFLWFWFSLVFHLKRDYIRDSVFHFQISKLVHFCPLSITVA